MSLAIIENPDDIVCTLQFKMKLRDWKLVAKTLAENPCYAELQILDEIRDLISQLESTLYLKA